MLSRDCQVLGSRVTRWRVAAPCRSLGEVPSSVEGGGLLLGMNVFCLPSPVPVSFLVEHWHAPLFFVVVVVVCFLRSPGAIEITLRMWPCLIYLPVDSHVPFSGCFEHTWHVTVCSWHSPLCAAHVPGFYCYCLTMYWSPGIAER